MKKITLQDFKNVFSQRSPGIQGSFRQYAVAVPVVQTDGEACLLYELRSRCIDRQPGEVCFPGGEIEPGESPAEAALRETREEIGITEPGIRIISPLDLFHPPTGIVIYPFLAEITADGLAGLKLNEAEVEECFTVPVSFLMNPPYEYRRKIDYTPGEDFRYEKVGLADGRYNWRPLEQRIISWEYEGKYIWGLTALITDWTLEILKRSFS